MTESLGSLLRATLSNKKSLVTLSYELSLINSYITIQQIRFEERLEFESQIPENLKNALLPPLTLQPLVENAIHYALEEIMETCYITIQAEELPQDPSGREASLKILVKTAALPLKTICWSFWIHSKNAKPLRNWSFKYKQTH